MSEKNVISFDLETIADRRMLDYLPDSKANARLKSPDKLQVEVDEIGAVISAPSFIDLSEKAQAKLQKDLVKAQGAVAIALEKISLDLAEKTIKQVAEMGLDPAMNMICSAAWSDATGKNGCILLKEESGEAEKSLLIDLWAILDEYNHFVTYNGRGFDIPCLLLHGMEYGVRPSVNIDKGRYNKGNHTDLRGILAGEGAFAKGKLDFFAKKYLGRGKADGMSGDQVQTYWDLELYEDIMEYNIEDAVLTMDLYKMADIAGLLE